MLGIDVADQCAAELDLAVVESRGTAATTPKLLHVVDLFCGAGGLATGFHIAGYDSVLGIDSWDAATSTFQDHHPTATTVTGDISNISNQRILELIESDVGEIGVVCGGPPCQGFSLAGRSLADDPRNFLYKHFLRIVELLQPRWVVMENVPALLKHPSVAASIDEDLRRIQKNGTPLYDVDHMVLNAAWFGVPQTRQRVIFIAKRRDVPGKVPTNSLTKPLFVENVSLFGEPAYVTFEQATSDLPSVTAGQGEEIMHYDAPAHTPYQSMMRGELSIGD